MHAVLGGVEKDMSSNPMQSIKNFSIYLHRYNLNYLRKRFASNLLLKVSLVGGQSLKVDKSRVLWLSW